MSDFPKLMWLPTGEEATVVSPEEQDMRAAAGFTTTPPGTPAPAPEPVAEPDADADPEP